ncbi:MAG TPA: hypothetical protein ACFCUY_05620 [Xenococcaceae cyanobacterium]
MSRNYPKAKSHLQELAIALILVKSLTSAGKGVVNVINIISPAPIPVLMTLF